MGQFMEALNSQPNLDDLSLSLESFQGGLDCNVDEVRKKEKKKNTTQKRTQKHNKRIFIKENQLITKSINHYFVVFLLIPKLMYNIIKKLCFLCVILGNQTRAEHGWTIGFQFSK